MLRENRDVMDKLAEVLIEKETITGKQFMEIFRKAKGLPEPEEKESEAGAGNIGLGKAGAAEGTERSEEASGKQEPAGLTQAQEPETVEAEKAPESEKEERPVGKFSNGRME